MDTLLETPVPLAIAGACVAVLGLALMQNGRGRPGLATLIVGLLLVPAAWALDASAVTDGEAVEAAARKLVDDFVAGRAAAVDAAISPGESALKALAAVAIAAVTVEDERVTDVSHAVEGDAATVRLRVNADFAVRSMAGAAGRRPTRWELTYAREGEDWKLTDAADLDPITGKRLDRHKRLR